MRQCFEVDRDPSSTRRAASRARKNEQIPLFFPRPAELRAVAGFTPCYHIGRESSSCDVLPANLKVKVGGDERETESHGWGVTEEEGPGATMSKCTSAA